MMNLEGDKLTASAAAALVYEYQSGRLRSTYSDFHGVADLHDFFFNYVYPHPSDAGKFAKRDEAFVRIARGRLLRVLTSRELIEYLEKVIYLREITARLDDAASAHVRETVPAGTATLSPEQYREAYTVTSTRTQREGQLDAVLASYELCCQVIRNIPFSVDEIFRFTPKIFKRNSELLELCAAAHRTFRKHRHSLDDYGAALRRRESAYIDEMFEV